MQFGDGLEVRKHIVLQTFVIYQHVTNLEFSPSGYIGGLILMNYVRAQLNMILNNVRNMLLHGPIW